MDQFNHTSGTHLKVDSAQIYYQELGDHTKPALLVLHGGFMTMEDMNPMLPYLYRDYRIIGMDSRGHGKSTLGDEPLTYECLALDAEALLEHLAIQSVVVIGFSDGATAALRMAINKRVNIEKLIVIGSTWSNKERREQEEMLKSITPESAKTHFPESYATYMKVNPKPEFDRFAEAVVALWLDSTVSGYPDDRVSEIACETLLIRGDSDYLTSLESMTELKALIENASFLNVPLAQHLVYAEQVDVCREIITQFLSK